MKIESQYLINTEYGVKMVVKTNRGKWFILTHHSLSYDGGGAAVWEYVDLQIDSEISNLIKAL